MRPSRRQPDEMRTVRFVPHFTRHAEGSVLAEFGETRVLCTASVEGRVPPFLKGKQEGWVTAEYGMLPRSTHTRTQREAARGKQSGRTQEIQRLIGRSLRAVFDLAALGERTIQLDSRALFLSRWRDLLLVLLDEDAIADSPRRREFRQLVSEWRAEAVPESVGYRLVRTFRAKTLNAMWRSFASGLLGEKFEGRTPGLFEAAGFRLVSERPSAVAPPGGGDWRLFLLSRLDATTRLLQPPAPSFVAKMVSMSQRWSRVGSIPGTSKTWQNCWIATVWLQTSKTPSIRIPQSLKRTGPISSKSWWPTSLPTCQRKKSTMPPRRAALPGGQCEPLRNS